MVNMPDKWSHTYCQYPHTQIHARLELLGRVWYYDENEYNLFEAISVFSLCFQSTIKNCYSQIHITAIRQNERLRFDLFRVVPLVL